VEGCHAPPSDQALPFKGGRYDRAGTSGRPLVGSRHASANGKRHDRAGQSVSTPHDVSLPPSFPHRFRGRGNYAVAPSAGPLGKTLKIGRTYPERWTDRASKTGFDDGPTAVGCGTIPVRRAPLEHGPLVLSARLVGCPSPRGTPPARCRYGAWREPTSTCSLPPPACERRTRRNSIRAVAGRNCPLPSSRCRTRPSIARSPAQTAAWSSAIKDAGHGRRCHSWVPLMPAGRCRPGMDIRPAGPTEAIFG
jgi:hypothetical protein